MNEELQLLFQENGWRYWDLRENKGPLDPSQFDSRVRRLLEELQRRLTPPYGISGVEDYTRAPRDERTLAILTVYETLTSRKIDVASVYVDTQRHVRYQDFTEEKKLEARLQGLKFE
ncbi:MAG: hypothetical protein PHF67_00795 [Candidatus Nanoarchaeia archaeon]|nr:hypothetical protein [Candidatus Nanoarchaeia archaeon]